MGKEVYCMNFDELGFFQYQVLPVEKLVFSQEIRGLCEANSCGCYDTCWTCPPAMGTVEECRERCLAYDTMLVFTGKYDLEDSFDVEGMDRARKEFEVLCDKVNETFRKKYDDFLMLAAGACGRCKTCTYPDAPCRFPEKQCPSLEGMGIYVAQLAKEAGINYINGANTVTYFGAVLIHGDSFD